MASEQKSTPGPWMAAAGPSSIVGWPVVADGGRLICTIATPPNNLQRIGKEAAGYEAFLNECGANALLIAAAPDMLIALKAFVYANREMQDYQLTEEEASARSLALAAIAKAVRS